MKLSSVITGAVALTSGFTNGAGQIWLDNVQCRGTETRLIDCPANPLGNHNCGHIEDAGVRCAGTVTHLRDIISPPPPLLLSSSASLFHLPLSFHE
jgi:hypothetical protein